MKAEVTTNLEIPSGRIKRLVSLLDNDLRPALSAVANYVNTLHVRQFRDKGRRYGGWKKISPVTAMLRRKGRGRGKIKTWKEAQAIANRLPPLSDTGRLKISLQARGAQHIEKYGKQYVTIGTNVKYARIHQKGGSVAMRMTDRDWQRFDRNVAKVLPGRRRRTPTGRRSRAKKNWNPFYFQMRAALSQPRRVIVPERQVVITRFTTKEKNQLNRLKDRAIRQTAKAKGLTDGR